MVSLAGVRLIAFDFFGTLATNTLDVWGRTFVHVVEDQGLVVAPDTLWGEWRKREVTFRETRTNMDDPSASPPFRTYWDAWREAFAGAFEALGLPGDPDAAATRCIEDHATRDAFPDASPALEALGGGRLAIMSNADDRFLQGSIAHNGWSFGTVVSSEQVRAYKPNPRIFEALCEQAQVPPDQVLYVGDSPYDDAHGAKLTGMRTVLVTRDGAAARPFPGGMPVLGQTPQPTGAVLLAPDYEIATLTELPKLLEN